MTRLTRNVFSDLALWMIGCGLLTGIVFPFFAELMGIPSTLVMTPWFFAACMAAGFIVGALNIGLARAVVGSRVRLLSRQMRRVEENLRAVTQGGDIAKCKPEDCFIPVDSQDELGESAQAFNRLVDALSESLHSEAAVRSFNETLTSQLGLGALSNQALQQLLLHTRASAGALLLEKEGELQVTASHGILAPAAIGKSDHLRAALRTEERQIINFPEDIAVEGIVANFRPKQVLVDPISHKHTTLGALVLAGAAPFSREILARLDMLRQGLALALNNALAHDRLQRLAAMDPLTGIYNRRFGMSRLHEEFSRAVRHSTPLGVMMLDIDHFKNVNDTYGHLAGDRVLARVARVARSVMREGDVMVRYGGEEFLVVLPAASKEDVRHMGQRLRRVIEETSIQDGDQLIRVTTSVGGTSYPEVEVDGAEDLVRHADDALLTSKQAGRNRVQLV